MGRFFISPGGQVVPFGIGQDMIVKVGDSATIITKPGTRNHRGES
jgi:hypothetical protein